MNKSLSALILISLLLLPAQAPGQNLLETGATQIIQPISPAMFPQMGEENQIFKYWIWSILIGKTTIGAWSVVNNAFIVAQSNINNANIQFQWQAGSKNPSLIIFVDTGEALPAIFTGIGRIRTSGKSFDFEYSITSQLDAEGLSRGEIIIIGIQPNLEELITAMQGGGMLFIEPEGLNLNLGFSLEGFAGAWQMAQKNLTLP